MAKVTRRSLLATASAAAALSVGSRLGRSQQQQAESDELKLWYTNPATQWVDALPIGNGRLGAMVYGGGAISLPNIRDFKQNDAAGPAPTDPAKETLQLNTDTLWSGMPVDGNNPDAKNHLAAIRDAVLQHSDYHLADELCRKMQGLFAEAYQPIGYLHIDCAHEGEVTSYRRELDLASAIVTSRYRADGVTYERTAFASEPDQAIVVQITASRPGALNATISLDGPLAASVAAQGDSRLLLTGKAAKHIAGAGHPGSETPVVLSDVAGEGMYFAAALQAEVYGGSIKASSGSLSIERATRCVLVVTAATGFRGFQQRPDTPQAQVSEVALRRLGDPAGYNYAAMRNRHIAGYKRCFNRVSLRLGSSRGSQQPTDVRRANFAAAPDPALLALYFQYGRYLLISSSRPGTQPANLQGIWSFQVQPPWSSNWTSNINVQMNYWPAETCNLSDCAEPLLSLVMDLQSTGRRAAQETYGLPGWVTHHNIDLWRAANPVGMGVGSPTWANWCMSGPWLCAHLYEHYRFTGNREFLQGESVSRNEGIGRVLPGVADRRRQRSPDNLPLRIHRERLPRTRWQEGDDQRRLHDGHGADSRTIHQLHRRGP